MCRLRLDCESAVSTDLKHAVQPYSSFIHYTNTHTSQGLFGVLVKSSTVLMFDVDNRHVCVSSVFTSRRCSCILCNAVIFAALLRKHIFVFDVLFVS